MSDFTVNASTNFANALNAISQTNSSPETSSATASTSENSTSNLISEFSTMMMIMLLGSMSSQGSSETGTDSMGMDMNQLMAPLMLTLLEKLTSSQVETATAADVAATQETTYTGESDASISKPAGWPAKGPVTQGCHSTHVGIDVGVSIGTKIKSTMAGEVVFAGWNNEGYGNLVIVKNDKYSTYYAHLSKIPVNVGDQVEAGDVIGLSGSTGNSTGPHLHYEIRVNGRAINPTKYMNAA